MLIQSANDCQLSLAYLDERDKVAFVCCMANIFGCYGIVAQSVGSQFQNSWFSNLSLLHLILLIGIKNKWLPEWRIYCIGVDQAYHTAMTSSSVSHKMCSSKQAWKSADHSWSINQASRKQMITAVSAWPICTFPSLFEKHIPWLTGLIVMAMPYAWCWCSTILHTLHTLQRGELLFLCRLSSLILVWFTSFAAIKVFLLPLVFFTVPSRGIWIRTQVAPSGI